MPIRFRCAYCNQLMGISTRKAGTVVKCPKCAGEIIVPSPDAAQATEEPPPQAIAPPIDQPETAPASAGSAFEEREFEEYFNEAANGNVGATAPVRAEPAPAAPMPDPPAVAPPPPPPPQRRGLFLTLPALIFSIIVIFLLLVLVFVLGVVMGRQSVTPPPEAAVTSASQGAIRHTSRTDIPVRPCRRQPDGQECPSYCM